MYIKYQDYNNGMKLTKGTIVLMSHDEFINGGKDLKGIPIAVTQNGDEPIETMEELTEPSLDQTKEPTLEDRVAEHDTKFDKLSQKEKEELLETIAKMLGLL